MNETIIIIWNFRDRTQSWDKFRHYIIFPTVSIIYPQFISAAWVAQIMQIVYSHFLYSNIWPTSFLRYQYFSTQPSDLFSHRHLFLLYLYQHGLLTPTFYSGHFLYYSKLNLLHSTHQCIINHALCQTGICSISVIFLYINLNVWLI